VASYRCSVAGVARVPTALRVVVAPLGAAMLAAARAASRAATGAAAEKAGNEAGLAAFTAVAAVATGVIVSPGTAVAGSGTRVAGADRGGVGLAARPLPLVGGGAGLAMGTRKRLSSR
jgi:hypothetical protein